MNRLSDTDLRQFDEYWVAFIAVLTAALLAAHQVAPAASFGLAGNYLYWLCRILIETCLFMAVLFAVENYLQTVLPRWLRFIIAILISLLPFVLAITAFDLIVGLPELGLNGAEQISRTRAAAFGLELIYLLDNHLALCGLLLLPRLIAAKSEPQTTAIKPAAQVDEQPAVFFDSVDPPLEGSLYSIEAQEHYVRVVTSDETRMILYRFSDAVRQIPATTGMQVHRSHWVAHAAVSAVVVKGQGMKLTLQNGHVVPVSRTFRASVESHYNKLIPAQNT